MGEYSDAAPCTVSRCQKTHIMLLVEKIKSSVHITEAMKHMKYSHYGRESDIDDQHKENLDLPARNKHMKIGT